MKASKIILGLTILIILTTASESYAQLQVIQTVTSSNKGCNNTCSIIEMPELNPPSPNTASPSAIIFITPSGGTSNPHPIGAYYMYQHKWSIKNTDDKAIPEGATFKVEYFANITGNSGFEYQVPSRSTPTAPAYIDYSNLNNNPNAQIRVCPVAWFNSGSGTFNKEDVKVQYDATAAKWFIANVNNTPVPAGFTYNVVFSNGFAASNPNSNKNVNNNGKTPVSTSPTPVTAITNIEPTQATGSTLPTGSQSSPNGNAGGDLSGNYPNPTVIGLQGRPLSNGLPKLGQVLRWGTAGWEPADESTPTTPTPTALPKSYYSFLTPDYTWNPGDFGYEVALPGMSIQITLTTPSIVNVSVIAQTLVTTDCGVINNCGGQATGINLYRNNTLLVKTLQGGSNNGVTQILPNYPELLSPGTYTYKVFGRRIYSDSNIKYLGASNPTESFKSYMSIQVFPQ